MGVEDNKKPECGDLLGKNSRTAFDIAAWKRIAIVGLLLTLVLIIGLLVLQLTFCTPEALFDAIENGNKHKAALILTLRPQLAERRAHYPFEPREMRYEATAKVSGLHLAARKGHRETAKRLLEQSSITNIRTTYGQTPLHWASEEYNPGVCLCTVKLLVKHGSVVDARASQGSTPLMAAAQSGNAQIADFLLKEGAHVNAKNAHGTTAFLNAESFKNYEIYRLLLQHGAKIDLRSSAYPNLRVLDRAAKSGDKQLTRLLLDHGAKVSGKTSYGLTALCFTVGTGKTARGSRVWSSPEVAQLLLAYGAEINPDASELPLERAVYAGQPQMVKIFLEAGANVNKCSFFGRSSLHAAALRGDADIAALLLEAGARPNRADDAGMLPLDLVDASRHEKLVEVLEEWGARRKYPGVRCIGLVEAARNGNVARVKELREKGVPGTMRDYYGFTALHLSALLNYPELAEFLLQDGSPVDARTRKGMTPLHLAAREGSVEIVRMLLDKGADAVAVDLAGNTPIEFAVRSCVAGDRITRLMLKTVSPKKLKNALLLEEAIRPWMEAETIRKLIEKGVDVNSLGKTGEYPLHAAVQVPQEAVSLCEMLIHSGADVNAENGWGETPLHTSVRAFADVELLYQNSPEKPPKVAEWRKLAELLIANGADLNVENQAGFAPLDLAIQWKFKQAVRFLKQEGRNSLCK